MTDRKVTVSTGGPDDLFPGCLVTWLHKPRGGYGYIVRVPAQVESSNLRIVTIKITSNGGAGKVIRRRVSPESLRWTSV